MPEPGDLARYPLLDALIDRRSRRFAPGLHLDGGPLAHASARPGRPLDLGEQAALAFAACGITGYALAELPYAGGDEPESGGGNIMMSLVGRTVASGDAAHVHTVFVLDDDGVWLLRRPQDYPRADLPELIRLARERRLTELYERARVRIGDSRVDVPREAHYLLPLNKWSANRAGTTYFVPVAELTAFYLNVVLILFDDDLACTLLDERNGFRPAGIGGFRRSKGGHLNDDPRSGRVLTIGALETLVDELAAVEQGGIVQNLGLMTQALGLGGFAHFAAHPWAWTQALGFRMTELTASRVAGLGAVAAAAARLLGRDVPVPTAVGLERDGRTLIEPFCPPSYPTMREAVLAFVETKYGEGSGTFRDPAAAGAWRDATAVQAGIPRYSDHAVEAAIAYCEYVYERYGRIPANTGPFRTLLAFQAGHLDPDFYERFYRPEALSETQRSRLG